MREEHEIDFWSKDFASDFFLFAVDNDGDGFEVYEGICDESLFFLDVVIPRFPVEEGSVAECHEALFVGVCFVGHEEFTFFLSGCREGNGGERESGKEDQNFATRGDHGCVFLEMFH